jgi:hypothetical protein
VKGREGKGREGKGREGKGREGKGRDQRSGGRRDRGPGERRDEGQGGVYLDKLFVNSSVASKATNNFREMNSAHQIKMFHELSYSNETFVF